MRIIYRNPDFVPLTPYEVNGISRGNTPAIIREIRDRDDTIHLWTFKPLGLWQRFYRRGILRTDANHTYYVIKTEGVNYAHFRLEDYYWMMEQMTKRLPNYQGRYPIWAYYVPHPEDAGFFDDKSVREIVRIEFCVPISRVLLSCFSNWFAVLNRYFVSLNEEEYNYWEQFKKTQPCSVIEAAMRKTWERIFDFDILASSNGWAVGSSWDIQATLEEIYLNEVVEVVLFNSP